MSTTRHLTLTTVAVFATPLLFALGAGAVWAHSSLTGDGSQDVTPTAYTSEKASVPQATSAAEAIEATLSGLDREDFLDVHLGEAPSSDARQGSWFYAIIAAQGESTIPVSRGLWEADLAQGATADRLAGGEPNLANVIVGSTILSGSADQTEVVGGGVGDVEASQAFASRAQSDAEIIEDVNRALAKYNLTPTEVQVLHPLDPAVAVRATVADADNLGGDFDSIRAWVLGDPVRYEGLYLEIDSPNGGPLVVNSVAFRSGAGRLWIAPGYDDVVGANHGGHPE